MILRPNIRRKNGKLHRYFSVVENRRTATGTTQRQVLYLGEINDSQQEAWRRTLRVFDEDQRQYCELSLFPEDRPLPPGAANAVSVRLDQMQLRRPRSFGDCWLGCWLWDQLRLSPFWNAKLADARGEVPWAKVLQLLVVNRLIDPGSELRIHRQWFLRSAMDELLGVDFAAAGKDRLYRCLDRILAHKETFCQWVAQQYKTLFDTSFDVLLYDLTSTYFEGLCEAIPKAKHGYNRDGRSECRQVVIALVVTTDGLALAYEVLAGNTTDKTTLRGFLAKIEQLYGKARRIWVMDRGIPTEATLKEMRESLRNPPYTALGMGTGRLTDVGPLTMGHRLATRETADAYQALIYNKGGLVLRMLHFLFSDPATGADQPFYDMMSDFTRRFAGRSASTDDFRAVAGEHFVKTRVAAKFGIMDLDWFFQQWVFSTALPIYRLEYSIAQEGDAYFIKGTVFQDGVPAGENWFMPLPLVVKLDGDKVGRALVYALGPETPVNFRIGSKPRSVELDPDMWVLSEKTTTKAVK